MASLPLVSIVTPSYNQAAFLEYTINSVLAQDYTHLEYIIVDGASNDGSIDIIHKYADKLKWWKSEADNGQAEAINKGFKHASGEIIGWLNSDDLLLPGAISQVVDSMEKNPAAKMVFSNAITIDTEGRPLNKLIFGDWGLQEFLRFQIICQPAVFMRRSILEEIGYLDQTYHYMLDHHLWLQIASINSVKHIEGFWAAARHHPDAKNVAQPERFSQEILRLLDWILTQPLMEEIQVNDRNHIMGGAYRLIARYFLDGRMVGESIKYYFRALRYWPNYTLKHAHRIIFALLLLLGIRAPVRQFQSYKTQKARKALIHELRKQISPFIDETYQAKLEDWPGLCLDI